LEASETSAKKAVRVPAVAKAIKQSEDGIRTRFFSPAFWKRVKRAPKRLFESRRSQKPSSKAKAAYWHADGILNQFMLLSEAK
jgi:hypothetical protein